MTYLNLTQGYQSFIEEIKTRILSSRYQKQNTITKFRNCASSPCTIKKEIKTHKNLILHPLVVKLSQRVFDGLEREQYIGSVIHG
jgi:hypothetical protein